MESSRILKQMIVYGVEMQKRLVRCLLTQRGSNTSVNGVMYIHCVTINLSEYKVRLWHTIPEFNK
jgi:hypothetical protein